jgi:hypothetical protein
MRTIILAKPIKMLQVKEIFVLYDLNTRSYLTFDPKVDRFTPVKTLKQLKIWDWQYKDNVDASWGHLKASMGGVVIHKLTFFWALKVGAAKPLKMRKLGRIINFWIWPKKG